MALHFFGNNIIAWILKYQFYWFFFFFLQQNIVWPHIEWYRNMKSEWQQNIRTTATATEHKGENVWLWYHSEWMAKREPSDKSSWWQNWLEKQQQQKLMARCFCFFSLFILVNAWRLTNGSRWYLSLVSASNSIVWKWSETLFGNKHKIANPFGWEMSI